MSVFFEENEALYPHQGAYRHGKFTENILLVPVDTIVYHMHMDKEDTVCTAFLDLQKAFDSLDYCILLHRLSDLGVSHVALHWFKNYTY